MQIFMRNFRPISKIFRRNMSTVFRSKRNPTTGEMEWAVSEENDEDMTNFFQDVARSAYADMLHDNERNVLYYSALKNVIGQLKAKQERVHVVDIGTGTGLLSMMAAASGADKVTAIETFEPVSLVARKIVALNGFSDKINVIGKRSNDVDESEICEKADVAVAEVFDTELIGENALKTFADAQKTLLKPNGRVIPSKAKFFAQLVQSDSILRWHRPADVNYYDFCIRVPDECRKCPGTDQVHDIQLNQLPRKEFSTFGEPLVVFVFDFEKPICFDEHKTIRLNVPADFSAITAADGGGGDPADPNPTRLDAVLTWWELDMDGTGRLRLSTEPDWSVPCQSQWRDHWIQSVYFLPRSVELKPNHVISLHASHDEYSFWFSASEESKHSIDLPVAYQRPFCSCQLHKACTRPQLARFNDVDRYRRFYHLTASLFTGKTCASINDCSLLSLMALQLGAKQVYAVESQEPARKVVSRYAEVNNLSRDLRLVESINDIPKHTKFDVIFSDCSFCSSFLPWHNLYFWRQLDLIRRTGLLGAKFVSIPDKAKICAVPVEFEHLWKIRAPVGTVEGFDLKPFDDVVQGAIKSADAEIEPQPLWEYPSRALSSPTVLLELNLNEPVPSTVVKKTVEIPLIQTLKCNGVCLWMEWYFRDELVYSGIKRRRFLAGCQPEWDRDTRQGVYFVRHYPYKQWSGLKIETRFTVDDVKFSFDFVI